MIRQGTTSSFTIASIRNYSFVVYESDLFLALGSAGWLIALLRATKLAQRAVDKSLLFFGPVSFPGPWSLAVGVVGEPRPWGVAQLDLQPVILLGLVLVATAWPTISKPLRFLMLLGLCCDFLLGLVLHFAYEHWVFPSTSILTVGDFNWRLKQDHHLAFIGDYWSYPLFVADALLLCLVLYRLYHVRSEPTEIIDTI